MLNCVHMHQESCSSFLDAVSLLELKTFFPATQSIIQSGAILPLFWNGWLLHRSSCNAINNCNIITPVAFMLGICQNEGLWVISYVNQCNLHHAELPRSLLKGKLWVAVLFRCLMSAILTSRLSTCLPTVKYNWCSNHFCFHSAVRMYLYFLVVLNW